MKQYIIALALISVLVSILLIKISKVSPVRSGQPCYVSSIPKDAAVPRFVQFKTSSGIAYHWDHQNVTYTFDSNVPDFAKWSFFNAFNQWSVAVDCELKFTEVPIGGEIGITWDDSQELLNPWTLAWTSLLANQSTGAIISANVTVNAYDFDFHSGAPRGTPSTLDANGKRNSDIDGVSLHEIGHCIGLSHSDLNPSAIVGPPGDVPTMNSILNAGAEKLHVDDIAGAQVIYGGLTFQPPTEYQVLTQDFTNMNIIYKTDGKKIPNVMGKLTQPAKKQIILGNGTVIFYFSEAGNFVGAKEAGRTVFR